MFYLMYPHNKKLRSVGPGDLVSHRNKCGVAFTRSSIQSIGHVSLQKKRSRLGPIEEVPRLGGKM